MPHPFKGLAGDEALAGHLHREAPLGQDIITATATRKSTGDTSEFSAPRKVKRVW